jgi:hypothetical protein
MPAIPNARDTALQASIYAVSAQNSRKFPGVVAFRRGCTVCYSREWFCGVCNSLSGAEKSLELKNKLHINNVLYVNFEVGTAVAMTGLHLKCFAERVT